LTLFEQLHQETHLIHIKPLGAQNAALNAGQAAGSILGGMLFARFGEFTLPGFGAAVILLALSLAAAGSKLLAIASTGRRVDSHQ
jgi:predicted MFS family arabinose efflux permease